MRSSITPLPLALGSSLDGVNPFWRTSALSVGVVPPPPHPPWPVVVVVYIFRLVSYQCVVGAARRWTGDDGE